MQYRLNQKELEKYLPPVTPEQEEFLKSLEEAEKDPCSGVLDWGTEVSPGVYKIDFDKLNADI